MSEQHPMVSTPRCHALDGMRLLAVLVLIPFHAAAIFYSGDLGEFYVVNPSTSATLSCFLLLVHQWHMPLFFFLAGAASWHSLQVRKAKSYMQERLNRLLLPLVAGVLTLVPPQVYVHELQTTGGSMSYFQFYPIFFDGIRPAGHFEWAHLWFLAYLLVITVLCLPLMLKLNQQRNSRIQAVTQSSQAGLTSLLLLALPLMLSEALLRAHWPGFPNLYNDWANFCLYLLSFIYGYWFCHHSGLWIALDRHRWSCVSLASFSMAMFMLLTLSGATPETGDSGVFMLFQAFRGLNIWLALLALMALARRFLAAPHPLMTYGAGMAMPLYLVHQPLLVGLGWLVVPLKLAIPSKFAFLCGACLLLSIGVVEGLIRRVEMLRFCFGLSRRHG